VAEMSEDGKKISISIYGRTDYSPQNCNYIITKIRDQMFPLRGDKERLALELVSYFRWLWPGSRLTNRATSGLNWSTG
jgi:hypothetical protein